MTGDRVKEGEGPVNGLDAAERQLAAEESVAGDLWNPAFHGDIDMHISADGTWLYQGTPILRDRLVRLFASILRREDDGKYYLVTPVEKVGITVEDAPFLAVVMSVTGQTKEQIVTLETSVGDSVVVGPDHPLRFSNGSGHSGPKPYVLIRDCLEALVSRSLFYDLVELGVEHEVDGRHWFGVWSSGAFFPMARAKDVVEHS